MSAYTFVEPRGVKLAVIKASPRDVLLEVIEKNVASSTQPKTGINGGFYDFATRNQLSVAVNNDVPVKGAKNGYGSGWFNHGYPRGTLVWDNAAGKYSVQIVASAADIVVTDRSNYWAQGGISMSMGDDAGWEAIAKKQNMPNMTGMTGRTALVWNSGMNIWLVISEEPCTAKAFRGSVKYLVGSGTIVDGVFLDGGGSTQMKCKEYRNSGDGRAVVQMVSLR